MADDVIAWPTDEGIWMADILNDGDWFPLKAVALKDDMPGPEPRPTLGIVAQWPESKDSWPFTFQGCHPVKRWRRPSAEELSRAQHFYGIVNQPPTITATRDLRDATILAASGLTRPGGPS